MIKASPNSRQMKTPDPKPGRMAEAVRTDGFDNEDVFEDESGAALNSSRGPSAATPKPSGAAWFSDRFLSGKASVYLTGEFNRVYGRAVGAVMTSRAQMEGFYPPESGEFSLKTPMKGLALGSSVEVRGQFLIRPRDPEHRADVEREFEIELRTRLPLAPLAPWLMLALLPAPALVAFAYILDLTLYGAVAGAGWVVLTCVPLFLNYAKRCRALAVSVNKTLVNALKAQAPEAVPSRVALVPARPVFGNADEEAPRTARPAAVRQPVAAPVPVRAPEPIATPIVAKLEDIENLEVSGTETVKPAKSKPRSASKGVKKYKRVEFMLDAQERLRAQMRTQLEAQLAALDQAEIELKAIPNPVEAPPARIETPVVVAPIANMPAEPLLPPVELTELEMAARPAPALRVRSRIKKFRTRYEAGARPETLAETLAETVIESDSDADVETTPLRKLEA